MAISAARLGDRRAQRIDTGALKQAHPIEDVVAAYGIELKRQGRSLVGRCPFHADGGRPNLTVFPATQTWFCFRCCTGGDVVKFIMLVENVGFVAAVERLRGAVLGAVCVQPKQVSRQVATLAEDRDPEELVVLQAATTLYHHSLLAEPRALAYLAARGLDRATIEQCLLGYAAGDQLPAYLRWQRLPIGPALRVGLLTRGGVEFLAGRVVVPDLCSGRPTWFIGRLLDESPAKDVSVHLGLPGPKPLLGLDQARGSPTVVVVEGSFDHLTLRMWGYPAVATLGTHVRAALVDKLRAFKRQLLVLDNDNSGFEARLTLQQQLGATAIPVDLPDGIKDPAQLATLPDGRERFAAALLEAVGQLPTHTSTPD
jgi:DNA primase